MDCDRAFVVLTRAPFPSGRPDDCEVERHLAVCPSCREIAEALRPAEEIEHESLPRSQRYALPAYSGKRQTVAAGHGRRVASRPSGDRPIAAEVWGGAPQSDRRGAAASAPQLAAFTLAAPRRSTAWEALSLLGLLASIVAGGWGLGLLVL